MALPCPVCFLGFEEFPNESRRSARLLVCFQIVHIMLDGVADCFARKRSQLLNCILRHDSQCRWKLRGFLTTIQKFNVLLLCECLGFSFCFEKLPGTLAALSRIDYILQMWPILVVVFANFVLPHKEPCCHLLPPFRQIPVILRFYVLQ